MKIGVDFDGVILDTERYLKYYADYYSYFELKDSPKFRIAENSTNQKKCFDWTDEEDLKFVMKYYVHASKTAPFMPGAKQILQRLKKEGHEIYIVSARGVRDYLDETALAMNRLKSLGIEFDGYIFDLVTSEPYNKCKECEKFGISLMVEDNPSHIKTFIGSDVKVLFFKDVKISDISGKNIKKIDTWMDIYLEVQKMMKNKNS